MTCSFLNHWQFAMFLPLMYLPILSHQYTNYNLCLWNIKKTSQQKSPSDSGGNPCGSTPPKTSKTMDKNNHLKMYLSLLLKKGGCSIVTSVFRGAPPLINQPLPRPVHGVSSAKLTVQMIRSKIFFGPRSPYPTDVIV